MDSTETSVLVTGGAGFIGSEFIRMLVRERPSWNIVVLDKLTYAGNLNNLRDVEGKYTFVKGDIADEPLVAETFSAHSVTAVVNFAAETHVDRSIMSGKEFIVTDVLGTHVLLEQSRKAHVQKYVQVSTDEVYGSISEGSWTEDSPLMPNSPYSASKAGGDLQVRAAHQTYGFPAMVTHGSNTYGPYHYPEKLIPLFITNLLEGKKVPVYGDGKQVRDWLHVSDHARGILAVLEKGVAGETYNLGSEDERMNMDIVKMILDQLGLGDDRIEYVKDRLGHDRRYSMSSDKAQKLGWERQVPLEKGVQNTVQWYRENEWWWKPLKQGEYRTYYKEQYEAR